MTERAEHFSASLGDFVGRGRLTDLAVHPFRFGLPDSRRLLVPGLVVRGERSESEGPKALDDQVRNHTIPLSGRPNPPTRAERKMIMIEHAMERTAVPVVLLSVDEAAVALGLSKTVIYELIRSKRLRSVKQGRRRLIPVVALGEYVDGLSAA